MPVPFGKPITVGNAKVTLTESGHILGAASVLINSGPATVFHTGDICMEDHFSIPSARLPDVRDIDLLIMEATLADQKPQPFSDSIKKMVDVINETTLEREERPDPDVRSRAGAGDHPRPQALRTGIRPG